MTVSLSLTFAPPEDRDERALRGVEDLLKGRALALQERASRRGQQRRDPGDGGVRPVRGAEGIPDEEVPEAREARGQLRVPLGLSRMEPDVLAEHHGPSGRGGDRLLDGRPHALLERDDL